MLMEEKVKLLDFLYSFLTPDRKAAFDRVLEKGKKWSIIFMKI